MEVLDYLRKRGAEAKAFFPLTPAEALPVDMPDDALCPNPGTYIRGADLLLCLGGDGTMLNASPLAYRNGKPITAVNFGTLGYMSGLEKSELNLLSQLKSGFETEKRMLISISVLRENEIIAKSTALNEAVVSRQADGDIAHIELKCDGAKVFDYRADGIIVATPTGSTAYSFSAGGPVIDPTANIFSVMPVCPHSLLSRAILLSPETTLTVSGRTRDTVTDIHVTMDGKNSRLIPKDAEIRIKKSEYTAKIIKIGANRFYDILETKLNKK
jgi:NAD+ kinase